MERILCLLTGYVFGLFQTGYLYGKMHHIDIRQYGSGNSGTTNALRVMGKKAGLLVFMGDFLKTVSACLLVRLVMKGDPSVDLYVLYAGLGVVLGHNFPFYLHFKGGKGIAASVGLVAAFDWRLFLICAVVFFTAFFLSHYVSLGSLLGYFFFAVGVIVSGQIGRYDVDPGVLHEMYILALLLMALAFWRHRQNIVRLIRGNENKIYLGKH